MVTTDCVKELTKVKKNYLTERFVFVPMWLLVLEEEWRLFVLFLFITLLGEKCFNQKTTIVKRVNKDLQ